MDSSELIQLASEAFAQGKPVMVFDSDFRECETDLLWPAAAATPAVCEDYAKIAEVVVLGSWR